MRLFWLFLILAVLVLGPFVLWGDQFADRFDVEKTNTWLMELGRAWAWLGGIGLLLSDLVLPIPGTVVMSALGYVYGPWMGGIFAVTGSMLSGILAYWLCWKLGRPAAEWIAGKEDLARGEALFGGKAGGWMVALSRWLPIMPEVIACLAGLVRMPCRRFLMALGCGSLPLGIHLCDNRGLGARESCSCSCFERGTTPAVVGCHWTGCHAPKGRFGW